MLEESLGPGSSIRDLVCEFRKWSVDVIAECLDSVTRVFLGRECGLPYVIGIPMRDREVSSRPALSLQGAEALADSARSVLPYLWLIACSICASKSPTSHSPSDSFTTTAPCSSTSRRNRPGLS